jgi:Beta-galactosidase
METGGLLFRGTLCVCLAVAVPDIQAEQRRQGSAQADAAPRASQDIQRQVAAIEGKITALERLVQTAKTRQIPVEAPVVSLTVARLFVDFIRKDAARDINEIPGDASDFQILGRDEALKRMRALPGFEAGETDRMLDRAIQQLQRITGNPALQVKTPPPGIQRVCIRNGAFSDGTRPVFISGIRDFFPSHSGPGMDVIKALGANLLGVLDVVPATCSRGWDDFDGAYFKEKVVPTYRAAQAQQMLVASQVWGHRAPDWLAKIAPDLVLEKDKGWFRDFMDLDHPLAERFQRTWLKYAAEQLGAQPNNFCYLLMGEEHCDPGFRSPHTARRYEDWLKAKYKNPADLNRAWGTNFRDFQEAASKKLLLSKAEQREQENRASGGKEHPEVRCTSGEFYDWVAFSEDRLLRFNQDQIDGIRQSDPKGWWTSWPCVGGPNASPLGGYYPLHGPNLEDVLRQGPVSGWDGGILSVEAGPTTAQLPESHYAKYNLGWRDEIIFYDFAKSVCPDKPVFDPELHTLTSVHHLSPLGVSADYLRTSLWMEHLHGLGAHLMWWWGRKTDGTPRFLEFTGGLLTQPQLLETWGHTVLELRRLAEYITLFPQLERKVRIYYSESTAIHDARSRPHSRYVGAHPRQVGEAYEALYFLDYPVGFATDRTIREGMLEKCALLVIPAATHVPEDVVAKISDYRRRGGRVVFVGKESLRYDEYGRERTPPDFMKDCLRLTGSTPEEYASQLDRLFDQAGIQRPVRVAGRDDKPVWGVELRSAQKNGKRVIYLINVTRQNVEVTLKAKAGLERACDLVAGRLVTLQGSFILEPRKPLLLELP